MLVKTVQVLAVCFAYILCFCITGYTGTFIPNLSERCYRCLSYISTGLQFGSECNEEFCGPFNISKQYWVDAGMITLDQDDPERDGAWTDCARIYDCAKRIVEGYLERFAKDCNGDGVTNCYDYMLINGNGGYGCSLPLNRTASGRLWLSRYNDCRIL